MTGKKSILHSIFNNPDNFLKKKDADVIHMDNTRTQIQ